MFCPKCGSILLPKSEKGKKVLMCSNCKYTKEGTTQFKEQGKTEAHKVDVVEKEVETLPETEAECPKCGNYVAYVWTVQTRAGDEPETKFYKCKKCKHIWRDYT